MRLLALSINGTPIFAPQIPNGKTPASLIQFVISMLLFLSIILCLVTLIYAGYLWIVSEGKKENIESAQNQIRFSVIGLIIVFVSFLILKVLGDFFQVNLLNIPTL